MTASRTERAHAISEPHPAESHETYNDHDRRQWYLETEAGDERVDAALETVR